MTTYTIAYRGLLYACVRDGDETTLDAELRDADSQRNEDVSVEPINRDTVTIKTGLILTNEEPEDEARIVWRGHDIGWLTDINGTPYEYAVRP